MGIEKSSGLHCQGQALPEVPGAWSAVIVVVVVVVLAVVGFSLAHRRA